MLWSTKSHRVIYYRRVSCFQAWSCSLATQYAACTAVKLVTMHVHAHILSRSTIKLSLAAGLKEGGPNFLQLSMCERPRVEALDLAVPISMNY